MKLTREKIDLLVNGTRDERVNACAKSFKLFAIFHTTRYFTFRPAPFQEDFFQDFEDLVYGKVKDAVWLAFRESAKTSIRFQAPVALGPCGPDRSYVRSSRATVQRPPLVVP
jgi:hypothetical protein